MKKFVLSIFIFSFISTASYAYHHEERRGGYNEDSFYDEYNRGYGQRREYDRPDERMDDRRVETRHVFKLKKGEAGKKRKYSKQQMHKQKMHHLKRRLSKLPPAQRDAALKEIERHHQEMARIIGDDKRFPEFRGMAKKMDVSDVGKMPKREEVKVEPKKVTTKNVGKAQEVAPAAVEPSSKAKSKGGAKKRSVGAPGSSNQGMEESESKTESNNSERGSGKWRYPKKVV